MKMTGWQQLWRRMRAVTLTLIVFVIVTMIIGVVSDPQTNYLTDNCIDSIANEQSDFFSNFNSTFADLRRLVSDKNKHFATAYQSNLFALFQCRNYLSILDCITCFDAALLLIRRDCPINDGAHALYEGCFLRYDSHNFFDEYTTQNNRGKCSNQTVSEANAFIAVVGGLLTDLVIATPKINGFFAAVVRKVSGSRGTEAVYAIAQCIETLSPSDCQICMTLAHRNIQSCPPQTGGSSISLMCYLRYSNASFFPVNQTINIMPYLDRGGSNTRTAIIGSASGGFGLLILILALLWWQRLLRKPDAERGDSLGINKLQGQVMYSYKDLKSATNNFSEEYKVGGGGFGYVYKGIIKSGDIVAVKKLAVATSRARTDFESEARLIYNVHHRNIIRPLGHSCKGAELLIVYEFMPNGSLDKFLYGEKRGTLSWKQRVDIIFGTARGLSYLHEQFHVHIIHRDIKSSNILLDEDFEPKIADFGLARLLPENHSHLSTRFAGTLGYTAPEYAIHGHLSQKVDTYSFGVVVLEIISGRRCTDTNIDPVTDSLLAYAWKLHEKDMHNMLIDKTIDPSEYKVESAKKIIEIALMCTQSPISLRPTMSEVLTLLVNGRSLEKKKPSKPYMVQTDKQIGDDDLSTSTPSSSYNATVTITDVTGR